MYCHPNGINAYKLREEKYFRINNIERMLSLILRAANEKRTPFSPVRLGMPKREVRSIMRSNPRGQEGNWEHYDDTFDSKPVIITPTYRREGNEEVVQILVESAVLSSVSPSDLKDIGFNNFGYGYSQDYRNYWIRFSGQDRIRSYEISFYL